jgi:prepilin-type N-terminal cleavage/methylation domain-containing protein
MNRTHGFTITEVLIALAVLTVVSLASLGPMVTSIRANGDNRTRAQAVIAANIWLDRFRGKTLNFANFTSARTYAYNYDYASDTNFTAANDTSTNALTLNTELKDFKFVVNTSNSAVTSTSSTPVWRVTVVTTYKSSNQGGESNFTLSTLTQQ